MKAAFVFVLLLYLGESALLTEYMANIFTRLFTKVEKRSFVNSSEAGFFAGLMGKQTASGVDISEAGALSIATVYSCVTKISQTIAGLPLSVYNSANDQLTKVDHRLNHTVGIRPDDNTTAFKFWEKMIGSALITGSGFAIIRRDQMRGTLDSLNFVPTSSVERKQFEGREVFEIKDIGTVFADDVIEINAPFGKSPIALHRETLGLAVASQDYGNEFFGNSGTPVGVLTTEQPLTQDQMNIVAKSWAESSDTLGTKVIPFGFKYTKISASPEDMQFIETRRMQDAKIAELYGVPTLLLGLESGSTFSNMENAELFFLKYTLIPMMRRIEQELNMKLIVSGVDESLCFRFDVNEILRGDMKARSEFYHHLIQDGVITINETRAKEGLNRVEIPEADTPRVQVNSIALDRFGEYSLKISK